MCYTFVYLLITPVTVLVSGIDLFMLLLFYLKSLFDLDQEKKHKP